MERKTREKAFRKHFNRLSRHIDALKKIELKFKQFRAIVLFSALALSVIFQMIKPGIYITLGVFFVLTVFFIIILSSHSKLKYGIKKFELRRDFIKTQIARMELDWKRLPTYQGGLPDENHPFESDLDLSGNLSVHHLMDISLSQEGSVRLREWLTETAPDLPTIIARQKRVKELIKMCGFRKRLRLIIKLLTPHRPEGRKLTDWLESEEVPNIPLGVIAGLTVLGAINIGLIVLHSTGLIPPVWYGSLAIYGVVFLTFQRKSLKLINDGNIIDSGIREFRALFNFLEKYPYSKHFDISSLCSVFTDEEARPSKQMKRLDLTVNLIGLRNNNIMWLILNVFMPWDLFCARSASQCKARFKETLPVWLETLYELEALISLANFAYVNPQYNFPEVRPNKSNTLPLSAVRLGHPLIDENMKVCNDISVDKLGRVILVTGSNMSGKSSFLKTAGINLALAYAGSAVNADSMSCGLFRLYTGIKINDSVFDGFSFFYAEVRRLKRLFDMINQTSDYPVFYLIDEIFRGTNNRERLIGSRSYIEAIAGKNGCGMITTHDLELVGLEKVIPFIKNYHFRETIEENRMKFEYLLREGPCPTTNALKIMRMEGLPVDIPEK